MTDYTYEVTDTGKYYYENNVRIFPEQFWQIIKKLEYENKELKKELALSKPLYSRRQLEKENEGLNAKNKVLYKEIERLKTQNEDILYNNAKNMELLEKENEQLKKENYELHKRLGDFEPFERYMKERTSKTSVNDIIGLVKTDEPTNSVELKKELYK